MAKINEGSFRDWNDGEIVKARDYKQEREIIRVAVNDTHDRFLDEQANFQQLKDVVEENMPKIEAFEEIASEVEQKGNYALAQGDYAKGQGNAIQEALEKSVNIIKSPTIPEGIVEGRLWADTSDNTYQGTVFEELNEQLAQTVKYVNIEIFGASPNHSDNKAYIQSAFDYAKGKNLTVYIPNKTYNTSGDIFAYNGALCHGTFKWNGEGERLITFARSKEEVTYPLASLSTLNENDNKINGLVGYEGGDVYLSSTEELIRRSGSNPSYNKTEISRIVDNEGGIFPSLDVTYHSLELLSVKIYPKEDVINVENLNVIVESSLNLTNKTAMRIQRSNIVVDNLNIDNISPSLLDAGLGVLNSCNVELNNYVVRGIKKDSNGYGVSISRSSIVRINNMTCKDARRGVSGRNSKHVRITGGSYVNIDSHWGNDFIIDSVQTGAILFAGKNIAIQNSEIQGSRILGIRNDTPELKGNVRIENNTLINTGTGNVSICTFDSQSQNLDYGRTLENPSNVVIRNNTIINSNDVEVRLLWMPSGRDYNQKQWGTIQIDNNTITKGSPTVFIDSLARYISGEPVNLLITNLTCSRPLLISVRSETASSTPLPKAVDLTLENIKGSTVEMTVDARALRHLMVKNCTITSITRFFDRSTWDQDCFIINCVLDNLQVVTNLRLHFMGNLCRGTSNMNTQTNIRSFQGAVFETGATGYYPNGHRNSSVTL